MLSGAALPSESFSVVSLKVIYWGLLFHNRQLRMMSRDLVLRLAVN